MGGTPPQGTIASMLAKLKEAGNFDEHPGTEELLGALPLIAGAWLSASPRRGWQGVGNALGAVGGLTEYDATTRVNAKADRDQQKKDAASANAFAGTLKPGESIQDVISSAAKTGFPIPTALSIYKDQQAPKGTGEEQAYQDAKALDPKLTRLDFHKQWVQSGKGPEKLGSIESAWQQSWLDKHPGDLAGAADYAAAQRLKYTRNPSTSVNIQMPLSPGDVGYTGPGGAAGTVYRSKSGTETFEPLPPGVKKTPPETKPPTAAQIAKEALSARNAAISQATKELTSSGFMGIGGKPNGKDVVKRAKAILLREGLDENGKPLPAGTIVVGH